MALLSLARRCEEATAADRELDCLIALAVHDVRRTGEKIERDDKPLGNIIGSVRDERGLVIRNVIYEPFTASIDAALTLVPENCAIRIDNGPCHWICLGKQKPMGRVDVRYPKPDYDGQGDSWLEVSAIAATPALALCAASLKARASTEATNG